MDKSVAHLSICPSCDLLLDALPNSNLGLVARCPRCQYVLRRHYGNPFPQHLALSISCLIMLLLANAYPLLSFQFFGMPNSANILQGTLLLLEHGFYLVGLSIILCNFIAPFLLFSLVAYTSLAMTMGKKFPGLATALHFQDHLIHWSMLEVYLVSFLVALVKLVELADIELGYGLWCICITLILSTRLVQTLHPYYYWYRYEQIS